MEIYVVDQPLKLLDADLHLYNLKNASNMQNISPLNAKNQAV